jgi:predicted nuclease with TOPRIM domain
MKDDSEKLKSLQWAIEELSKQREELDGKLKIARKREETGSLIDEVYAQKQALEKRINALEDGLKVSSELVDTPLDNLEDEISKVNDKLEIAQERLESLEQEQYLENLGRKLNRSHDEGTGNTYIGEPEVSEMLSSQATASPLDDDNSEFEKQLSVTTQTMSSPSNRIESDQTSSSRLSEETVEQSEQPKPTEVQKVVSVPVVGLEETALKLGLEPDFLVTKGTQALLRMIARNGGELKFPLELEQIE